MKILETIQAHANAMHLPLYAVTLSAVAKADTPLILMLHWHGFRRQSTVKLKGIDMPMRSVAGSALQINSGWKRVESLDQAMLDAAWQLGAWDLERANHRPYWRLNAPLQEAIACRRAFGDYPDNADCTMMVEAPDQAKLLELAASTGYVRWIFRPRASGVWGQLPDDDKTLKQDGTRNWPCPVAPQPYDRHRAGRSLYRLGEGAALII
ncbi:MAG TPA: diguanylate cyclase [Eoetvoesiella sp.]|uniref:diguanylate cyclase n=1 Tax=Eoetvoesiella sp. TaxID=1966355 RepID=UPI002BCC7FF4|nr:diguanylate cyclase [Eoetvoesiella sp.]HWK61572.1 diguanylate cyclase [Eoetvoesiella sp.]